MRMILLGAPVLALVLASCAHKKSSDAAVQEQAVRDLELDQSQYTPPDQVRKWVREWPANLKIDPAALMGQPPDKK